VTGHHDTQHLTHCLRVSSEQKAQGKGEADHPLAQRYIGKDFIGQQGCGFGHTACATAGAKASLLTAISAG